MNILWIDWNSYGKEDILAVLTQMGHKITSVPLEAKNYRMDPRYKHKLKTTITEQECDLAFSSNYFPVVSDACREKKIPYAAWCYDSPMILLYHKTIVNPCNYIFVFDSHLYFDLCKKGVQTVYYMPMAVNPKRLQGIQLTEAEKEQYQADISFVGSMYNEKHNLYDRMAAALDDFTKGYAEAVMEAQRRLYGIYFLEDVLDDTIVGNMQKALRFETSRDGFETLQYVYAGYFLCRKMAERDRKEALSLISRNHSVKLYTHRPTPELPLVQNMGQVDYEAQMPKVFMASRINLNITLRSIVSGIPLRAMDIMGAGGFLLTNYQADFGEHFIQGEDYVCYEGMEDMVDKIDYYLAHDREREQIAANGCKKVREEHSYEKHLTEILDIVAGRQ